MKHKQLFIVLFVTVNCIKSALGAGCTISINKDLGNPQPLVIKPNHQNDPQPFYLPSNHDTVVLNNGGVVNIACPGSNIVIGGKSTSKREDKAICNNGKFLIDSKLVVFSSITCRSLPSHTARYTNKTCLGPNAEIEIGFQLSNEFLRQILICFDNNRDNVLSSQFFLTKTIAGSQVNFPRPGWTQGRFYHVTGVDNLYSRNTQRTTINALLGLPSSSFKYVAKSGDLYLSRGHLTAKADFLYGSQQRTTFYFINAVPQWQTFNNANWGMIEKNVRDYASTRKKDLFVYTGTHGVTTLKHEQSKQDIPLYLYVNGNNKRIPVPQLMWKIVYEPIGKSAIVLIGVNNPYRTPSDLGKDIICQDICNQVPWVTWNRSNLKNGYGYCCHYNTFRMVVTKSPFLIVNNVLT